MWPITHQSRSSAKSPLFFSPSFLPLSSRSLFFPFPLFHPLPDLQPPFHTALPFFLSPSALPLSLSLSLYLSVSTLLPDASSSWSGKVIAIAFSRDTS